MNDIYALWRLYQNHFSSARRLVAKTRVGSKWVKKYDAPKTPYQSADGGLDSPHIAERAKQNPTAAHDTLNPFHLKKDVEKRLRQLFRDLWKHEP